MSNQIQKEDAKASPGYCMCCGKSYERIDSELIPTCFCSQHLSLCKGCGFCRSHCSCNGRHI